MDKTKWLIGGALCAVALALTGCSSGSEAPQDAPEAAAAEGKPDGQIALTAQQIEALALKFAAGTAATSVPIATLPAMIVPPPNARVAVAAQLSGIVTRIFVVDGQQVRAGQPLATVSSRDIVSLNAELARARARLDVAQASSARLGQLSREGIIAPARADEARAQYRQAQVDVTEQSRLIGMANGAAGGSFTLSAPISGRISAMSIETGKALDPGAAPFVIDGGGPMQASAQLPERLVGTIQPGMTVRIGRSEGKVLAVGTAVDPATRSTRLTASLPADGSIRAGQAVSLAVMGPAPAGAVRVPGVAITQLEGQSIVFVRTPRGVVARQVTVGEGGAGADGERVVLSGLKAGDQVAISAVSELKALASEQ